MNAVDNPIRTWLQNKFESWRYQNGKRKTLTEFAAFIGISEDQLLRLMNSAEKPKGSCLAKLAGMLGYEIYEFVGVKTSDMLDALPPLFRIRFASAFTEYIEKLQTESIDKDSPEAQQMLQEIMKKYKLLEIFC